MGAFLFVNNLQEHSLPLSKSDVGRVMNKMSDLEKISIRYAELVKNIPENGLIDLYKNLTVNNLNLTQFPDNSDIHEEFARFKREEMEREENYRMDVLKTLQNIEKNTGNIVEIVNLIRENNDKQDQVIELLGEILSVGASKTKEEAETKYKQIMKRIQDFSGTIESIQKLYGVLNTVYNSVSNLL